METQQTMKVFAGRTLIKLNLEIYEGRPGEDIYVLAKKLWRNEQGLECALAYHPLYNVDLTFMMDPRTNRWRASVWFAPPKTPATKH